MLRQGSRCPHIRPTHCWVMSRLDHEASAPGLANSILADLARMMVRQSITVPTAGVLQSGFSGGEFFGLFHEGVVVG